MRLVFLNTLNGQIKKPLKKFIDEQCFQTDIFCFQEADKDLKNLILNSLSSFQLISDCKYYDEHNQFSQATYIKNNLQVKNTKTLLIDELETGLCIYTSIKDKNRIINVCNVHGIAQPGDKLDTKSRLKQSQVIIDFLKNVDGPKIIGGDFNLEFDTQSVKLFEDNGYRNLIKEYKIKTTRNRLTWDLYPNNKQYYADYLFITPDIKVLNFSVPNIEISDHLPLILEIKN